MTAVWKFLDWKNRQDSVISQNDLPEDDCDSPPVSFPDNDTPVDFVFRASLAEIMLMLSALEKGAILSYPDTWHNVYWLFVRNLECTVSICDQITECLQPQFDALTAQITDLQAQVSAVADTQDVNGAKEREVQQSDVEDEICGAATAVVEAMHQMNLDNYNKTEGGLVDSAFELIPKFIAAVPILGDLPFDELFELVDWQFEHQVEVYETDFPTVKDGMICDLKCFVVANDNVFTFDVWADWLNTLDAKYPGNAAAGLFARYSATRQTFINQIAAFINANSSLQTYFDTLSVAWDGGLLNPVTCVDCECPGAWSHIMTDADVTGFMTFPNLGFPVAPVGSITGDDISATSAGAGFVTGTYVLIDLQSNQNITSVVVNQTAATNKPGGGVVNEFVNCRDHDGTLISNIISGSISGNGTGTLTADTFASDIQTIEIQYVYLGATVTQEWTIEIHGFGFNPFE